MSLLDIRNLTIQIRSETGWTTICQGFDLSINEGEILGLIGSSGSGKSIIARAIIGMHNKNIRVHADRFKFMDIDLSHLSLRKYRRVISRGMAIIMQQAKASLDPSRTILEQMKEALPNRARTTPWYKSFSWRRRTADILLHKVGIRDTKKVLKSFPYQLSEVLCQKISIAMAIGRKPKLLIADDPVSCMTSISQLQILRLLDSFNQNSQTSILFIANDLAPVANLMDRISMIYIGYILESGPASQIISSPHHPFTDSMLKAIPELGTGLHTKTKLPVLAGDTPEFTKMPLGCPLGSRCPRADKECSLLPEITKLRNGFFRCHFPINMENNDEQK